MKGMKGYYPGGDFINMKTIYNWIFSHKNFMIDIITKYLNEASDEMSELSRKTTGDEFEIKRKEFKIKQKEYSEILMKLRRNNKEELEGSYDETRGDFIIVKNEPNATK